jgi:hypothetical protein
VPVEFLASRYQEFPDPWAVRLRKNCAGSGKKIAIRQSVNFGKSLYDGFFGCRLQFRDSVCPTDGVDFDPESVATERLSDIERCASTAKGVNNKIPWIRVFFDDVEYEFHGKHRIPRSKRCPASHLLVLPCSAGNLE